MPVVDIKTAKMDLEILIAYLDYFMYFEKGHVENLRAWLSTYRKPSRMDPITLNPGETHMYGGLSMTNLGTKRYLVALEVHEL